MSVEQRKDLYRNAERMRRVYDCRRGKLNGGFRYRLGTNLIALGLKLTGGREVEV
jgi:hypothetical protein